MLDPTKKPAVRAACAALLMALCSLPARAGAEGEGEEKGALDWGARLRLRQAYIRNPFDLEDDNADDWNYFRVRSQLWGSWAPDATWKAFAMINNEHRHWLKSHDGRESEDFEIDEVIFENLYLEGKGIAGTPFGFRAGRQNIFYGEGFLCWDGGPLDGSRTAYFNAVLLTADLGGRRVDIHFISNPETDEYLPVVNDQDKGLIEWDETGAGIYYIDDSFGNAKLEGYYFYKNEDDPGGVFPESDIHTVGARASSAGGGRLSWAAEWATQIGDRGESERLGYGGYAHGSLLLPVETPLSVKAGGLYLSGDDPDTEDYEGWNPLYSRWPKWSELFIYTLATEKGIAYWQNLAMGWVGLDYGVRERIELEGRVKMMWAPQDRAAAWEGGNYRGTLTVLKLNWSWTENLSGHLLWETLQPGGWYGDGAGASHFLRWEIFLRY